MLFEIRKGESIKKILVVHPKRLNEIYIYKKLEDVMVIPTLSLF